MWMVQTLWFYHVTWFYLLAVFAFYPGKTYFSQDSGKNPGKRYFSQVFPGFYPGKTGYFSQVFPG